MSLLTAIITFCSLHHISLPAQRDCQLEILKCMNSVAEDYILLRCSKKYLEKWK